MNITPQEYDKMSRSVSPKSRSIVNIPVAFAVGGAICVVGQRLLSLFEYYGFGKTARSTWTSVILIGLSALCTGLGWYAKLAKHAGAGTLVPITGFANAVSSSAIEARSEGYVLGVGAKIFTIAGPVILYGCTASVAYGLLYCIFA